MYTTHLMEEADKATRLLILDEGNAVALDSPDALRSEIGGDVVDVRADKAEELSRKADEQFGAHSRVVNGTLRFEMVEGHAFVARLAEAFPGEITSVTVSRPTLEDVFIQKTGHQFFDDEG